VYIVFYLGLACYFLWCQHTRNMNLGKLTIFLSCTMFPSSNYVILNMLFTRDQFVRSGEPCSPSVLLADTLQSPSTALLLPIGLPQGSAPARRAWPRTKTTKVMTPLIGSVSCPSPSQKLLGELALPKMPNIHTQKTATST
jgi:hypothetical protein